MRRRLLSPQLQLLMLMLCCTLSAVRPAHALFGLRGAYVSRLRGGYGEEKVPMTIVVPDFSPRPAPFASPARTPAPSPAPAVAPVPGSDDDMPTLPSERRSTGREPSGRNAGALPDASAPAPVTATSGGTSTAFISSSPAVPLPAGVTDSATVLPMPTPTQERQAVAMGTMLQATTVPFAIPLAMMLSFWALW
ncbi:hypothetical protein GUJ93_ZPchr0014g47558 [Zizania palustris]|uniref:Uncharacterized protein n=1 Tax=Zizania palustris TaxID=103762 RepID=A0A8J5TB12_ZIZPA|nr:hypothetical protein GUJ93_ZPchr0014g47558 [Zizania palustris]